MTSWATCGQVTATRVSEAMSWVLVAAMEGGSTSHVDGPASAPASDVLDGRYELGDRLGAGGMADVYAARDRLLGRDVAIKFFRPLDDQSDRARFVGEARMLAGLSHPGLVTVYDASFDGRQPYLIMRLVDGGTLRRRLNSDGPLEPDHVAKLGARLATALAHVHANGIVHRDIKPSNVLIDSDGDYFLADFGLAWALGSARHTNTGEMVGTPCYLAPEQVTGAVVGRQADIYALGLVLLECLTGRTEYDGTDVEVAVARLSRPPTVPEEYEPSWRRLLTAMTDMHPSNRPDAMACARRLHAITQAHAGTRDRGTTTSGRRWAAGGAAPAAEGAGPATTDIRIPPVIEPRRPGRTSTRLRRAGNRAGLGAAGAAGLVLTAVLLTTPAGTAGEPMPGSRVPGRPTTTAPADDRVHEDPVPPATKTPAPPAAKTVAPPAARPAKTGAGTDRPAAREPAPTKAGKPKNGAKAHPKGHAGPGAGKPAKPR